LCMSWRQATVVRRTAASRIDAEPRRRGGKLCSPPGRRDAGFTRGCGEGWRIRFRRRCGVAETAETTAASRIDAEARRRREKLYSPPRRRDAELKKGSGVCWQTWFRWLSAVAETAERAESTLRPTPDEPKIKALLITALEEHYGSLEGCVVDPDRAAREEFGDLLAEGLYAAFEGQRGSTFEEQLRIAMEPSYWDYFKTVRLKTITETLADVRAAKSSFDDIEYRRIEKSLETAETWALKISSKLCVEFIESWQEDEELWQKMLSNLPARLSKQEALRHLGLSNWVSCGYGLPTESESDLAPAGVVFQ